MGYGIRRNRFMRYLVGRISSYAYYPSGQEKPVSPISVGHLLLGQLQVHGISTALKDLSNQGNLEQYLQNRPDENSAATIRVPSSTWADRLPGISAASGEDPTLVVVSTSLHRRTTSEKLTLSINK